MAKNSNIGWNTTLLEVAFTARADAGVLGSWHNTTGRDLLVLTRGINVGTTSTGAATVDAGIAATAVTNDTLIDGQALNGLAAKTVVQTAGTNGAMLRVIPSGYYVTAFGSADTTGLVASMWLLVAEMS